MKKIVFLYMLLLTTGYSKDLYELGLEAYNKGDYNKSVELYTKACNEKSAIGCLSLGFSYEIGRGIKQDYYRAAMLYKKAGDDGVFKVAII